MDVSWYPFRNLYLFASRIVRTASGSRGDRLNNYGLNWSPFPGGDLVFNFSYYETRRAADDSIDKQYIPTLRWNITRRTYAIAAYSSTKNTSIFGESTTRLYSTSLNMNF